MEQAELLIYKELDQSIKIGLRIDYGSYCSLC